MSAASGLGAAPDTSADSEICYICLQEAAGSRPLLTPCNCKGRPVHKDCLARWQLFSSGRSEETSCRFCFQPLPDWRPTLLGDDEPADTKPLMAAVVFNNIVYKIPILPGAEGKAAFKKLLNERFGLRLFDINFEVKVQEDKLSLHGLSAYEAATRCAAVSARRAAEPSRGTEQQQQLRPDGPSIAAAVDV